MMTKEKWPWGFGMRENFVATAAIKESKITKKKKMKAIKKGKIPLNRIMTEVVDQTKSRQEVALAVLGVSEELLERSINLDSVESVIQLAVLLEKRPSRLKEWTKPFNRKRALDNFWWNVQHD